MLFILLGVWQLNRAFDLRDTKKVVAEIPAVSIETLDTPNSNLLGTSVNRLVNLNGKYLKVYLAPNQRQLK